MKHLAILALTIIFAACATVPSGQTAHASLDASVHSLVHGETSLPVFEANDLTNAKAIFDANFAATSNPYDAAGSRCVGSILAHLPELQALGAPPTAPKLGAPVTGLFSSIAAKQVTAEDAQRQIAEKLALLRNGIPPDVHVNCAYVLVEPAALLHGLASQGGK